MIPPRTITPHVVSATFLARWEIGGKTLFLFNLVRPIYCHAIRDTYHPDCTMDSVALRNLGVEVPPDTELDGWEKGRVV